jgi:hypothetical protein
MSILVQLEELFSTVDYALPSQFCHLPSLEHNRKLNVAEFMRRRPTEDEKEERASRPSSKADSRHSDEAMDEDSPASKSSSPSQARSREKRAAKTPASFAAALARGIERNSDGGSSSKGSRRAPSMAGDGEPYARPIKDEEWLVSSDEDGEKDGVGGSGGRGRWKRDDDPDYRASNGGTRSRRGAGARQPTTDVAGVGAPSGSANTVRHPLALDASSFH